MTEWNLLGRFNDEKAQFCAKLCRAKPAHVMAMNAARKEVVQAIQLSKRFLAAQLTPLYKMDLQDQDFNSSFFKTKAFVNVTRVKKLSDLTQEEIDELFKLSNAEYESVLK